MTKAMRRDPKSLFMLASGYSYSAQLLALHTQEWMHSAAPGATRRSVFPPCSVPSVVLTAFSLELYLKCLILLTASHPPKIHSLSGLYNSLPASQQSELKRLFGDFMSASAKPTREPTVWPDGSPIDKSFEHVLARHNDAFKHWRYPYDAPGCLYLSGSEAFIYAAERTILKMKPEWQELLTDRGSLPCFAKS